MPVGHGLQKYFGFSFCITRARFVKLNIFYFGRHLRHVAVTGYLHVQKQRIVTPVGYRTVPCFGCLVKLKWRHKGNIMQSGVGWQSWYTPETLKLALLSSFTSLSIASSLPNNAFATDCEINIDERPASPLRLPSIILSVNISGASLPINVPA